MRSGEESEHAPRETGRSYFSLPLSASPSPYSIPLSPSPPSLTLSPPSVPLTLLPSPSLSLPLSLSPSLSLSLSLPALPSLAAMVHSALHLLLTTQESLGVFLPMRCCLWEDKWLEWNS